MSTIQPDTVKIGNRPLHVLRMLLVSPETFPLRPCQGLYQDEIYERAFWHVSRVRVLKKKTVILNVQRNKFSLFRLQLSPS